ncbi:hypothetical protein CQ12_13220 [Bradyrhizobium jicamae]|uniref:Uncharacterized protein n=1 Tax=Bradyrhizobium jicamae TaxID=280332 RepID=A0A0R3LAJ4_9BRAD|nr:hypothetical protein [Bradyrhizobium jicamae]KRR01808.1 hypothetical protein CQ12_13220 [Bradyrhizobium jicamae]
MIQSAAALPGNADLYLHVRVLIALILGLSVTRLVSGIAGLVQHPGRYPIWPVHLAWVAWTLLNVVTFWWFEFRLSQIQHWTYGLYFFVCVYASMYYFLSVLLFPQDLDEYQGYEDYFLSRRRWFFGFAALTEALDVVDTWIKGEAHLRSLGMDYLVAISAFILLSAIAARTRNPKFHLLFALAAVAYEISFAVRHFGTLD